MPRRRYTSDEELLAAAANAQTLLELSATLGRSTSYGSRRQLRLRLERLGVDTARFGRQARWAKYDEQLLDEAARHATSVAGVLRHLGLPLSGGNHTHISRRLRALGIDTSHFSRPANKGHPSPRRRTPEQILVVRPPGSQRESRDRLLRAMLESGVAYACAGCLSLPEWNGRPLRLHIDHINGDWLDNRLENLRFLCPNCHSQTDTYCSGNRRRKASSTLYEECEAGQLRLVC